MTSFTLIHSTPTSSANLNPLIYSRLYRVMVSRNPSEATMPSMGGHGQGLLYNAWVCFFLCEEALITGECMARGTEYGFELAHEVRMGQAGRPPPPPRPPARSCF